MIDIPTAVNFLRHLQELLKSGSASFVNPDLQSLLEQCDLYDPTSATPESESAVVFHTVKLEQVNTGVQYFRNRMDNYVKAVEKCIASRFQDLDAGILHTAGRILDTRLWPLENTEVYHVYGNDEIRLATKHFSVTSTVLLDDDIVKSFI